MSGEISKRAKLALKYCEQDDKLAVSVHCDPKARSVLKDISGAATAPASVKGRFGRYTIGLPAPLTPREGDLKAVHCLTGVAPGNKECEAKVVVRVKGYTTTSTWGWKMRSGCSNPSEYLSIGAHKTAKCAQLPTVEGKAPDAKVMEATNKGVEIKQGIWADFRNGATLDSETKFENCPFDSCQGAVLPFCVNGNCVNQLNCTPPACSPPHLPRGEDSDDSWCADDG